jgi:hypothetical protein
LLRQELGSVKEARSEGRAQNGRNEETLDVDMASE